MDIDVRNLFESIFRWGHVVAGITWIGLLYFFNWVNGPFAGTMDGDTKKKVVPELMPRALFWFRWGAMWTWITGAILASMVYYSTKLVFEDPQTGQWGASSVVMLLVVFLAFAVYDPLMKAIPKPPVQAVVGFVATVIVLYLLRHWAGFSYRGTAIHMGAMFGTLMFINVWMRIWPNQRRIITAVKNGEKPDPAVVGLAGIRSKHNTYMSVPLVFAMISQHGIWAASGDWTLPLVILVGWGFVFSMYRKAGGVKGF
jgi:uncharacterized membrane protein